MIYILEVIYMAQQVCEDNDKEKDEKDVVVEEERIKKGGAEKYHKKLAEQNKLFARQRLELLLDPEFQLEDGLLANCMDD